MGETKTRCETCGSTNGYWWNGGRVIRRRYSDGLEHEFCTACLRKRQKANEEVQAAAYRKRKKTIQERGAVCQKCGKETGNLHQHHIRRVTDGGGNENSNLLLLCTDCHKKQHLGFVR